MNRVIWNKFQYAIYSPFVWVVLFLKGIETNGRSFWNGFPSIDKNKESTFFIGAGCKFASRHTGNRLGIFHPCMLTTAKGAKLRIGSNCSFSGVSIWCFDSITFGKNVRVGANVTIMDGDAHQDDPRAGKNAPIYIEDNVWIGGGVTILKGVTIGRNSIIGAGSIVTKDIPVNVVAAGNPCKVIKSLEETVIKKLGEK